jgi:phosphoribosylglycinamide formyltransferase-1
MKLLVLASGSGTLAQAVIDAGFDICAVLSDVPDAQVIERAKIANIETKVIPYRKPRSEWDKELFDYVSSKSPDLVVSVGFMRILNSEFVSTFKVINSHPALLPAFPGAHAVRDALAAGTNVTGCTVHWVDEGIDTGKIIAQKEVEVLPNDDESSLHERIKIVERELIVKAIKEVGELS